MYEKQRLRIEAEVAVMRRAVYRALAVAESSGECSLEDDLHQLNAELGRIMDGVLSNRLGPRSYLSGRA